VTGATKDVAAIGVITYVGFTDGIADKLAIGAIGDSCISFTIFCY